MAVIMIVAASGCVWAQGPSPSPVPREQQLDVQQQRVLDLKDYREWLEGQLALAKALLNEARHQAIEASQVLAQKEADLAACRTAPAPAP